MVDMNGEPITPVQAASWAQENKTIMAPDGTVDQGRIADLGAAQRMANFENITHEPGATEMDKEMATKAVSTIEATAEVDASGLTEEQKANIEAIKSMAERHPGVFQEEIEGNQRFWKIKSAKPENQMFLSADGVYSMSLEYTTDDLDKISLSKVADRMNTLTGKRSRIISGSVSKDPTAVENMGFNFSVIKLDLNEGDDKRWFSNTILLGEQLVRAETDKAKNTMTLVDALKDI